MGLATSLGHLAIWTDPIDHETSEFDLRRKESELVAWDCYKSTKVGYRHSLLILGLLTVSSQILYPPSLHSIMGSLSYSFCPGEILSAGTPLVIQTSSPISPQEAQGAITVWRNCKALRLVVQVDSKSSSINVPTDNLEPGAYELVVGELRDTNGGVLGKNEHQPFVIGALRGSVPFDIRVEHAVLLSIGETSTTRLTPGQDIEHGVKYLEIVKGTHRKDLTNHVLAFDKVGQIADGNKILTQIEQRRFKKFGRLHESLYNHLASVKDDDSVDIFIYPQIDTDLFDYDKPTDRELKQCPEEQTARLEKFLDKNRKHVDLLKRLDVKFQRVPNTVASQAALSKAQIMNLMHSDEVGSVHLNDSTAINDLSNSVAIARSDRVQGAGYDGKGVRVAVFENGPDDLIDIPAAAQYTTSPSASDHARLTHAVIKNTEAGQSHGHAPGCDLYSANSSANEALTWACQQNCSVISQSFHRSNEPSGTDLQSDDLLKDMLALTYPYPFIAQAAGNYWLGDSDNITPPESEVVNHKGYNTISVGNHDDDATAMDSSSVFNNPTSPHGDRELPEISANGTAVTSLGLTMSGTSFAAPAVAGVAALIQQIAPIIKVWPEGMRAILLASAKRNISGGTWWADVVSRTDASDGAGALDADSARSIALTQVNRNNSPTARGWAVGTIREADFDPTTKMANYRYWITVPRTGSGDTPETIKVCLAWDSKITSAGGTATSSRLTVDLDLWVRDTNQ